MIWLLQFSKKKLILSLMLKISAFYELEID